MACWKSFGVNAGFDAQSVKPLLEAVNPRVDVLGHLIVAHADHAFAGGVLFRLRSNRISSSAAPGPLSSLR